MKQHDYQKELFLLENQIFEINMAIKKLNPEFPLKGSIIFRRSKCGKKNCRCAYTNYRHGPYPHLEWWEDGKKKTKYLNSKIKEDYTETLAVSKAYNRLMKEKKRLIKRRDKVKTFL